jgi:hypothetical protein
MMTGQQMTAWRYARMYGNKIAKSVELQSPEVVDAFGIFNNASYYLVAIIAAHYAFQAKPELRESSMERNSDVQEEKDLPKEE